MSKDLTVEQVVGERRRIKNLIKRGKLPRYTLVKDPQDDTKCETEAYTGGRKRFKVLDGQFVPRRKRTWRLVCTIKLLTSKD